jgi:hypothetical protein
MVYAYLIGVGILFIFWLFFFILRKDLRKPMIWSGLFYLIIIVIYHLLWIVLSHFIDLGTSIVPTYWEPKTLFDMGLSTRGMAIEDLLFMFFVGGIATSIYEFLCKKEIKVRKTRTMHILAPLVGSIVAFSSMIIFKPNAIYPLIIFGFAGAIVLWAQRKDLFWHSIFGGFGFLIIYFLGFSLFNIIFPDFISTAYHLENLSGILIFNIPIEEYLYAISFGLMWAPIYEYEHGDRVRSLRKK